MTQPAGFDSVTPMFISDTMDQYSLELILRNEVDFIVVDTRLVNQTQKSGCFYEGCTGYGDKAATVTPEMVAKFEDAPGFDLVLDGPVKIYDVREVRGVRGAVRGPTRSGAPGHVDPVAGRRDRAPAARRASCCDATCSTSGGSGPATRGGSRSSCRCRWWSAPWASCWASRPSRVRSRPPLCSTCCSA